MPKQRVKAPFSKDVRWLVVRCVDYMTEKSFIMSSACDILHLTPLSHFQQIIIQGPCLHMLGNYQEAGRSTLIQPSIQDALRVVSCYVLAGKGTSSTRYHVTTFC